MSKLKTFFRTLRKSLTSFPYYKEILKAKFSFSFKYLYFLLYLINLVLGIWFAVAIVFLMPLVPNFLAQVKDVAYKSYPSELVVTIDNGKVKTNVKEPYFIDFPKEFRNVGGLENFRLVTIDTKAQVGDYPKYNTVVLVTGDSVVYPDSSSGSRATGTYKVVPLSQAGSAGQKMVIDKAGYDKVVTSLLPYLNYVKPLMWVGVFLSIFLLPFLGASMAMIGKLVYLLITSLIVLLVIKIMKKTYSYSQIYRISMHGLTLPILISFVLGLFGINIQFLYTIVFTIFMIMVFAKMGSPTEIESTTELKGNEEPAQ